MTLYSNYKAYVSLKMSETEFESQGLLKPYSLVLINPHQYIYNDSNCVTGNFNFKVFKTNVNSWIKMSEAVALHLHYITQVKA